MCMSVVTPLEHGQPINGSTPKEDVIFPHTRPTPQPVNAKGTSVRGGAGGPFPQSCWKAAWLDLVQVAAAAVTHECNCHAGSRPSSPQHPSHSPAFRFLSLSPPQWPRNLERVEVAAHLRLSTQLLLLFSAL